MLVKIDKYIGFSLYRRSYLIWPSVIVHPLTVGVDRGESTAVAKVVVDHSGGGRVLTLRGLVVWHMRRDIDLAPALCRPSRSEYRCMIGSVAVLFHRQRVWGGLPLTGKAATVVLVVVVVVLTLTL